METQFAQRKIIHVDMDAFYASVEQLDNPEFRGKPIVVGGEHRGVVSAASYEARKFGVYSAMSSKIAKQKCPHLIFVYPRFHRYKEVSNQIREIFHQYTDLVEPLSLDEAYLDVTENKINNPFATKIAKEIRQKIVETTGLTASAGISINKFLAKIASDYNKPNGQKTILPEEVESFLEQLPIEKFYGIGKVTTRKMYNQGIFLGKDLKDKSLEELEKNFGKSGKYYYYVVRGIHNSPVQPFKERKSVGVERTFFDDIINEKKIFEKIWQLADELEKRIQKSKAEGKTITLKLKYNDFSQFTRSRTLNECIKTKNQIIHIVSDLWKLRPNEKPIRLLGISISNFTKEDSDIEKKTIWVQLEIPFLEYL